MSLLERIKLIEDSIIELDNHNKTFLEVLEEINGKLDRLLSSREFVFKNKTIDQKEREVKEEPNVSEEVDMDFSNVLVMNQTDKALLVVKKGYQQWLAKSLIAGGGDGYDNGTTFDIPILEISPKSKKPTKWLFKKWEKFEVFKN